MKLNARIAGFQILVILTCAASAASAQPIDFELTPGGVVPTDDSALVGGYVVGDTTVSFGFDTNSGDGQIQIDTPAIYEDHVPPAFEVGESSSAYSSGSGSGRLRDPDFSAGLTGATWFIRRPSSHDITVNPFVVVYEGALPTSASGQIWDIDATPAGTQAERYTVEALDINDQPIASQISPLGIQEGQPGSLDGLPWTFSFDHLSAPIKKITVLQSTGPNKGFGFDNFNATGQTYSVPAIGIPGSLSLGAGLLLTAAASLRRPTRR